jgi:hypothetical protein
MSKTYVLGVETGADSDRILIMGRAIRAFAAAAWLLHPDAAAGQEQLVLFFCDGEPVAPDGVCDSFHEAFRSELADLDVEVRSTSLESKLSTGFQLPPAVAAAMAEAGAVASVWLTGNGGVMVHVYIPDSLQTISKVAVEFKEDGTIDYGDAAFRLRTLLSAALFTDLSDIEVEVPEPPAAPEPAHVEPAPMPVLSEWVAPVKAPRRLWVSMSQGYVLLGYPTRSYWYHGIGVRLGVLPVAGLEVFVDADITFPHRMKLDSVRLDNSQYVLGLGAAYRFRIAGPLSLTPLAGFHVGVSDTLVTVEEATRHRRPNTAVWAGLEIEVSPARWISITAGAAVENLFNYEYFEIEGSESGRRVFSLAQLRMSVTAGASVRF